MMKRLFYIKKCRLRQRRRQGVGWQPYLRQLLQVLQLLQEFVALQPQDVAGATVAFSLHREAGGNNGRAKNSSQTESANSSAGGIGQKP